MESLVDIDQLGPISFDRPWVLIVGGTTRGGNRAARQRVVEACSRGLAVVWIDGFEEKYNGAGRVALRYMDDSDHVLVVCCADAVERRRAAGAFGRSARGLARLGAIAAQQSSGPQSRVGPVAGRLMTKVEQKLIHLGHLGDGRALWGLLRPHFEELDVEMRPEAVIYCDDAALTTAWHLAQEWRETPTSSRLSEAAAS